MMGLELNFQNIFIGVLGLVFALLLVPVVNNQFTIASTNSSGAAAVVLGLGQLVFAAGIVLGSLGIMKFHDQMGSFK